MRQSVDAHSYRSGGYVVKDSDLYERTAKGEQILADRGSVSTIGMGEVALLANSGFGSLLVVPVGAHAMIQAFARDQRPWSRAETNRALVLAYQLAPVLATLAAHAPAA